MTDAASDHGCPSKPEPGRCETQDRERRAMEASEMGSLPDTQRRQLDAPGTSAATSDRLPFLYGVSDVPTCPRCGREVKANEHVVRLTLLNGEHNRSTDMQGTFHHACAAELFLQFEGRTRDAPLREPVKP